MGATAKSGASQAGATLRATLCEIERGVFYATYVDQEVVSQVDSLAHYQTGASAAEAKRTLELNARALGYDTVVWTETVVAPIFASRDEIALDPPVPTHDERRV